MCKTNRTYSCDVKEILIYLSLSIKAARLTQRLTAESVAMMVGISRSTLQRIEKGDGKVEFGTVLQLALLLGVNPIGHPKESISALIELTKEKLELLPRANRVN
jgi:transcriptional regulator with XRE-family HTH domain